MLKTVQRLLKQYPDKIEEYSLEGREDGYWLYLKPGWKREPCDEVQTGKSKRCRSRGFARRRLIA